MLIRLEGILLTGYGCLLFYIIFSGRYGLYMNPKYMWMTVLSAVLLLVYGVYATVFPSGRVNRFYLTVIGMLLFLMLAVPARELGVGDMLFSPF